MSLEICESQSVSLGADDCSMFSVSQCQTWLLHFFLLLSSMTKLKLWKLSHSVFIALGWVTVNDYRKANYSSHLCNEVLKKPEMTSDHWSSLGCCILASYNKYIRPPFWSLHGSLFNYSKSLKVPWLSLKDISQITLRQKQLCCLMLKMSLSGTIFIKFEFQFRFLIA